MEQDPVSRLLTGTSKGVLHRPDGDGSGAEQGFGWCRLPEPAQSFARILARPGVTDGRFNLSYGARDADDF